MLRIAYAASGRRETARREVIRAADRTGGVGVKGQFLVDETACVFCAKREK